MAFATFGFSSLILSPPLTTGITQSGVDPTVELRRVTFGRLSFAPNGRPAPVCLYLLSQILRFLSHVRLLLLWTVAAQFLLNRLEFDES